MRLIAHRMDVEPSYLSQLERGRANWSQILIDQYNDAMDGKPLAKRQPMQKLTSQPA
jgi:hypothetical protein